jgi:hypothetical protein
MARKDYPFDRRVLKSSTKLTAGFIVDLLLAPFALIDLLGSLANNSGIADNKVSNNISSNVKSRKLNRTTIGYNNKKAVPKNYYKINTTNKPKNENINKENPNKTRYLYIDDNVSKDISGNIIASNKSIEVSSNIKLNDNQKQLCFSLIKLGENPNKYIAVKRPQIGSNVIRKSDKKIMVVVGITPEHHYICLDILKKRCGTYSFSDLELNV